MKKKSPPKKYNTGGMYQPVGLPVEPAEIRRQKAQQLKEQGNFWTGLGQWATNYAIPLAAGPLSGAISTGLSKLNTGGPLDSIPYTPTVTNPHPTLVTPSVAPPSTNTAVFDSMIQPIKPKYDVPTTVGFPGPVAPNVYMNLKEGSSAKVKSKDRYREKQYGGDIEPPLRFLGRSWVVPPTKWEGPSNVTGPFGIRDNSRFSPEVSHRGTNKVKATSATPYMDLGDDVYYNPYDKVFNFRNKDGSYSPIEMSRDYTRARSRVGGFEKGQPDPASLSSNVSGDARKFIRDTAYNPYMRGFDKLDPNLVDAHIKKYPAKMATGGDVSLNSSAFQVQGNPQQVDGNTYQMGQQQVALDHNEVVKNNFVYSDSLTNPLTGNKYSQDAKIIEKSVGKSEMKINKYKDLIANKTLKYQNMMSDDLATNQEIVATVQGHRNIDGSTKQNFANGGPLPWDGFDVGAFQTWYNNLPGSSNKLTVDSKWGPTTSAAYMDVAEAYLRHTGKNIIPDLFGGRSVTSPDGTTYANVSANVSPSGKVIGSNVTTNNIPALPATPQAPDPFTINPAFSYQVAEDGTPLETFNENIPYKTGPFSPPIPTYTTVSQAPITDPTQVVNNPRLQLGQDLSTLSSTAASTANPNKSYMVPFTAGDALQAVAVGSQFFQALSPIEVEPTRANTSPISRETYDPRAALGRTQGSYQNAVNSIQSGSINMRRNVANQLAASKINTESQVLDQYNRLNTQAGTQYEERLAARQRENIGYKNYAADLNARNRAARANNLNVAFTSLAGFGQGLNEKRQAKDTLSLYRSLFPNVSDQYLNYLLNSKKSN